MLIDLTFYYSPQECKYIPTNLELINKVKGGAFSFKEISYNSVHVSVSIDNNTNFINKSLTANDVYVHNHRNITKSNTTINIKETIL